VGLNQYPRVYSTDASVRRDKEAIGLAPLGVIIAVSLLQAAGLVYKPFPPLALFAAAVLAGLYALLSSRWIRRRVVLHEDGIELLGVFSSRKLNRSEILGRRMEGTDPRNAHGTHYVIVPIDKGVRVLSLPSSLKMDGDFRAWMKSIPKITEGGHSKGSPFFPSNT
jgi:hypothetical protein